MPRSGTSFFGVPAVCTSVTRQIAAHIVEQGFRPMPSALVHMSHSRRTTSGSLHSTWRLEADRHYQMYGSANGPCACNQNTQAFSRRNFSSSRSRQANPATTRGTYRSPHHEPRASGRSYENQEGAGVHRMSDDCVGTGRDHGLTLCNPHG
jgi:hypothetical protein